MSYSEESGQANPLFLRLLELKAKYSAMSHDTAPATSHTPPVDVMDVDLATPSGVAAAGGSVATSSANTNNNSSSSGISAPPSTLTGGPRAAKRRKIGIDADSLHRWVSRILPFHRGAAHVDVLTAALMPQWSHIAADDATHASFADIRTTLRHHLQTYRLNETQPVYAAVRGDAHVWTLHPAAVASASSLDVSLEDKDGILLLPGAAAAAAAANAPTTTVTLVESLGHTIISLLQSYATQSPPPTDVEASVVATLASDAAWSSIRSLDPDMFDTQARLVLRHHPVAIKSVAALGNDELVDDVADPMDEDTDNHSPQAVHANGGGVRRPRPPRRAVTHGTPHSNHHSSRQPPHSQSAVHGNNMPGSAVQAAKQRRMHQMHHGGNYRSPPVGRARPRQPKARTPNASSRASAHNHTYVTLSAGVLGLQLSAAASAARSVSQLPAENSSCTQCSAAVERTSWFRGPTTADWLCASCGEVWSREHSCPVCGLVYDEEDDGDDLFISADLYRTLQILHHPETNVTETAPSALPDQAATAAEQSSWIACDDCGRWVMTKCDGIVDLSLYDDENPNHLPYKCPLCRGAKDSIPHIFFTRHSAPAFAKLYLSSPITDANTKLTAESALSKQAPPEAPSPNLPKKKSVPKPSLEKEALKGGRATEDEVQQQHVVSNGSDSNTSIMSSNTPDVLSHMYETEKLLMDQWMRQRESVRCDDPLKLDQLKLIERKLVEKIHMFRDSMNHALAAILERNRQEYESQAVRLRKEHAVLDQLAKDEIIKLFEMHFKAETEKFSQLENILTSSM